MYSPLKRSAHFNQIAGEIASQRKWTLFSKKNVDIQKSLLISYLIRSEVSQAREERMQTLMQQCFTSQSFDCRRHASTSLLLSNPHNSHWGVQFFLQEQRNMVLDFCWEWVSKANFPRMRYKEGRDELTLIGTWLIGWYWYRVPGWSSSPTELRELRVSLVKDPKSRYFFGVDHL